MSPPASIETGDDLDHPLSAPVLQGLFDTQLHRGVAAKGKGKNRGEGRQARRNEGENETPLVNAMLPLT